MIGYKLVYLDNAATSQKPVSVLKALRDYYEGYNANVHHGVHAIVKCSAKAADEYELARKKVADFINSRSDRDVLFTRNASEAINLVAYMWGLTNFKEGDEIVLSLAEHHSNIVPGQLVAQKTGAVLRFLDLTSVSNIKSHGDEEIGEDMFEHLGEDAVELNKNTFDIYALISKICRAISSVCP